MEKEDKFVDVELSPEKDGQPQLYIDSASTKSLCMTTLTLLTFMLIHLLAAWRSPNVLAYKDEYFKLNQTNGNASIDIDLTLSMLQDLHRFVDVTCALLTDSLVSKETVKTAEVNSRVIFSRNYTVINSLNTVKQPMKLVFPKGASDSSSFQVIHRAITGFDTVQVKVTISCDFTGVNGLVFRWAYANPSALKYSRSVRILMSFLMAYMLLVYTSFLKFDDEVFSQAFCLVLGVSGVFASNPISLLLTPSSTVRFCDSIFMALFVALLRMFITTQFEMLRSQTKSPGLVANIAMFVFFAIYGIVDAAANHERIEIMHNNETESKSMLPSEQTLILMHCVYFIAIIAEASLVYMKGGKNRRVIILCAFAVCEILVTTFSQIICPKLMILTYSILPSMTYSTGHMVLGSFLVFFMHTDEGHEYKQFADDNDEGGCLDVEEASSSEDIALDEEEDLPETYVEEEEEIE